jgi:hypothetical protein
MGVRARRGDTHVINRGYVAPIGVARTGISSRSWSPRPRRARVRLSGSGTEMDTLIRRIDEPFGDAASPGASWLFAGDAKHEGGTDRGRPNRCCARDTGSALALTRGLIGEKSRISLQFVKSHGDNAAEISGCGLARCAPLALWRGASRGRRWRSHPALRPRQDISSDPGPPEAAVQDGRVGALVGR